MNTTRQKLSLATAGIALSLATLSIEQTAQAATVQFNYTTGQPEQSLVGFFTYADDFAGSILPWDGVETFSISINGAPQLSKVDVDTLFNFKELNYRLQDITNISKNETRTTISTVLAGSLSFSFSSLIESGNWQDGSYSSSYSWVDFNQISGSYSDFYQDLDQEYNYSNIGVYNDKIVSVGNYKYLQLNEQIQVSSWESFSYSSAGVSDGIPYNHEDSNSSNYQDKIPLKLQDAGILINHNNPTESASVPEPSILLGFSFLSLGWLLKKKKV